MVMASSSWWGEFEVRARVGSRAGNLRLKLEGALWASPAGTGRRVSASFRARFRSLVATLNFLQVLNTPRSSTIPDHQRSTPKSTRRYSSQLGSPLRKLWSRIFRKRVDHQSASTRRTLVTSAPALTPSTLRPNWTRLRLRPRSSEHLAVTPSQEPVNGLVLARGFLGADHRVAMAVHGVGMVCTLIVLVQLATAGWLPLFLAVVTGLAVVGRVVFLNRCNSSFAPGVQQLWREALSIGGLAALVPQALGVVFRPFLLAKQSSFISSEGVVGCVTLIMVLLARYQRLPFTVMQFFGVVSAGIPAILVLWAPITQLWNCWWRPADVNFVQILTGLLAVLSNCFLGYSESQKPHQALGS